MTKQERRLPTRRDALANRERLLAGAEEYFAEYGIDAPLHTLAKKVGVGIGTVYRNFPAHPDFIRALYDRILSRLDQIATESVDQSTAWATLEGLIRQSTDMLVSFPASTAIMRRQHENDPEYRPDGAWNQTISTYVEQAKSEGALRDDISTDDVAMLPLTLSSVQTLPKDQRAPAAERLLTVALDGIRTHPHEATPIGVSA